MCWAGDDNSPGADESEADESEAAEGGRQLSDGYQMFPVLTLTNDPLYLEPSAIPDGATAARLIYLGAPLSVVSAGALCEQSYVSVYNLDVVRHVSRDACACGCASCHNARAGLISPTRASM